MPFNFRKPLLGLPHPERKAGEGCLRGLGFARKKLGEGDLCCGLKSASPDSIVPQSATSFENRSAGIISERRAY